MRSIFLSLGVAGALVGCWPQPDIELVVARAPSTNLAVRVCTPFGSPEDCQGSKRALEGLFASTSTATEDELVIYVNDGSETVALQFHGIAQPKCVHVDLTSGVVRGRVEVFEAALLWSCDQPSCDVDVACIPFPPQ